MFAAIQALDPYYIYYIDYLTLILILSLQCEIFEADFELIFNYFSTVFQPIMS